MSKSSKKEGIVKYDVNGWKILGRQFENDADIGDFFEKILGVKLVADDLSDGKYLFDYEEIAAIIDYLDLSMTCRVELLTEIISERSKSKGFSGISGFRQLLCAIFSTKKQPVKCLEITKLHSYRVSEEKLSDFIRNMAENTVKLAVPPQAFALKITDSKSASELALPCGSLIVIDAVNPPDHDELTLFLKLDRTFAMGILNEVNAKNSLWRVPVLRLHIIPGEIR